jgi:glycosyltransferase involved in cell wall biosynthesis
MNDAVPRLLVDVQTAQGGFFGNRGIRRYALGFARALLEQGVVRALLLNPGRPWHEEFPAELRGTAEVAWSTRSTLRQLDAGGASGYVITSPFEQASPVESVVPPFVFESGIPIVAVLYDLIPEIVDVYPPSLMAAYWARRRLLREVDLLLTLSEHVRAEAIERLEVDPQRVAVVGAAASSFFRGRRPGEQPHDLLADRIPRITRPFVLSVTGWLANKNATGLIRAWSHLPEEVRRAHQLVLTCPLPPGADAVWNDLAADVGLAPDDVVVTGRVDDEVVRALYQEAELLVAPSYEEGFGLPVLEAARCGCPAITSSTSSSPEVLEWDPSTFPPHDADAMAAKIERGLLDSAFRADLRAVGEAAAERHTWDRVADRTIRVCSTMPAPRRQRRVPQPRVALVGRLTAATPRVADAIDHLAASLTGECRVDSFDIAAPARTRPAVSPGGSPLRDTRRYPARALGQIFDPWGYDALVYLVDQSPARELVDLARDHPGVVWFVDAPDDRAVAAELARRSTAILRSPEVAPLDIDPGPFGRAVPASVVVPDGPRSTRTLLETIGVPVQSVRLPAG